MSASVSAIIHHVHDHDAGRLPCAPLALPATISTLPWSYPGRIETRRKSNPMPQGRNPGECHGPGQVTVAVNTVIGAGAHDPSRRCSTSPRMFMLMSTITAMIPPTIPGQIGRQVWIRHKPSGQRRFRPDLRKTWHQDRARSVFSRWPIPRHGGKSAVSLSARPSSPPSRRPAAGQAVQYQDRGWNGAHLSRACPARRKPCGHLRDRG